ncbi:interleukin-23 receptor [Cyclopterus lumpus]|uniref:interleukin-23 receptor n=1 Tax=Cyclopterus lumpus TaxID=8103 RepID=UPI001486D447|nr:interleukin-23 receptor [Cyclopterus lumpus]
MNLSSTLWRFIITLLGFPFKRGPLPPAGCQRFIASGYLTVNPSPLFLIGSNLTVYCFVPNLQGSSTLYLKLNGETVTPSKKFNSTTVIFSLFNVRKPRSVVLCKLKKEQLTKVVAGLDLHGGLPPDKPENVLCEMSRSSVLITCTWERGRETHLLTTYNVSLCRENGTQILFDQIRGAGDVAIRRAEIDEDSTHRLIITAYNHFGASPSDPFTLRVKDIMIPERPRIVQIEFNSSAARLRWETSGSSESLRPDVHLRAASGSWEAGAGTELAEGLIRVAGLRPLTDYEVKMRTCGGAAGSNSSERSSCSKWSPSVWGRSPGKGPSLQMHVWRTFGGPETGGLRTVTVLWKPPSPDDYSGAVQSYRIFLGKDQKEEVTCPASLSRSSLQVSTELRAMSISAVTSYGTSPSADVPLGRSGAFGPDLRELVPSDDGSSVFASWLWPENGRPSTSGGEPLHHVLEWTSVPVAEPQWQQMALDQNSTFIRGLSAGVRYNISLYAVTTRGVSAPSSRLVYSKEQKPTSGPNMSVLVHKSRRILIQWDELPVVEQKGFITNYTIYLQTLDASYTKLNVTVPGSAPRQMWLDCPEGALALQMTASTSAGEGQRGGRVYSQHEGSAVGLVVVMVFIVTLFVAIVANLMCWSCVRRRVKQKCVSWGPAWLYVNLPKLGNSNAIKLLEYGSEPFLSSTHSDPPLSPISLVSQEERDDVYPTVHVQSGAAAETPSPTWRPGTTEVDSYKPQAATPAPRWDERKETEDERRDGEEDRCPFGGLLGGFLTGERVDLSDPALGLTLADAGGFLWPKTPETTIFLDGDFLLGRMGPENRMEADSLDSQQGEILIPESTCFSQYTVETLTGGYFPQAAALSSSSSCRLAALLGPRENQNQDWCYKRDSEALPLLSTGTAKSNTQ